MEIIWTDLALESLSDIVAYVECFFGNRIAKRVAKEIVLHIEKLKSKPYYAKSVLRLDNGREIKYTLYKYNRIYFQEVNNRIEIIIVWDGRQDPKQLDGLITRFISK